MGAHKHLKLPKVKMGRWPDHINLSDHEKKEKHKE